MQSFSSGIRTRFTTNPGVSWQRMGRLPRRSPTANAAWTASSDDSSARTISTSGMSGAGLKKCMPTTRLWRRDRRCDLGHRERRGIRREDRIGANDPLELVEEIELRAELLDDRLDHEITVREVGELRRQRKQSQRRFTLARGHPLLVHLALEEVRDPLLRLRAERIRDLATDGLIARFDCQLRDPGAHGTEPHHADTTDLRDGHDGRDPTRAAQPSTPVVSRCSGADEQRRRCANPRRRRTRAEREQR